MTESDRFFIVTALDYYLRNKEPDPVAGGIAYKDEMQSLLEYWSCRSSRHD